MSKAEETVVYKFSDFTPECAESITEFDQKQWIISIEHFHEAVPIWSGLQVGIL